MTFPVAKCPHCGEPFSLLSRLLIWFGLDQHMCDHEYDSHE